jgi:hypothetical protein
MINMIKFRQLLFPVMLGLSCTLQAQVYKSTDADGNVIFSDTPAADSEEVQIPEPNLADPVEVPEYVPPPEPPPKAAEPQKREPGEELIGESYEYDSKRDRHRWKEIRPRAGPANIESRFGHLSMTLIQPAIQFS